jgi:uncharacterized membrane protein required for colicin V production
VTWLDVVCLLLILLIASVASWQGTVRSAVALVGFYLGGKLAQFIAERLAFMVGWFPTESASKAFLFLLAFLVVAGLTFLAAYLVEHVTQFSLEEADHLVAFPIGLLLGITLTHWVVQMMVWSLATNPSFSALLQNSPVAKELLTFQATKGAIAALFQWSQSP